MSKASLANTFLKELKFRKAQLDKQIQHLKDINKPMTIHTSEFQMFSYFCTIVSNSAYSDPFVDECLELHLQIAES